MKLWRVICIFVLVLMLLVLGTGVVLADEESPEEDHESEGKGQNPVALYLADQIEGLDYDTIRAYQEDGIGLGHISKAYYLIWSNETEKIEGLEGLDLNAILEQAREMGWGNFYKSLDLHPGGGHGLGWMFKEFGKKEKPGHGKPEWAGGPPEHANNKDKNKD